VGQNLSCLRRFIHHCEKIEAVKSGLLDKVPDARIPNESQTRDEKVDHETAEAVLSYLRRFDYASRRHAIFKLVWHTAFRTITLRCIDIDDCHLDTDAPYIELKNRPETDTRLKNGSKSRREVTISVSVAEVLQDYIKHERFDVEDGHGRSPLFTTSKAGRPKTQSGGTSKQPPARVSTETAVRMVKIRLSVVHGVIGTKRVIVPA